MKLHFSLFKKEVGNGFTEMTLDKVKSVETDGVYYRIERYNAPTSVIKIDRVANWCAIPED